MIAKLQSVFVNVVVVVVVILVLTTTQTTTLVSAVTADQHESCEYWAASGECQGNPGYMMLNCAASCAEIEQAANSKLDGITSFYDLQANDIDGNLIEFSEFEGKVVILTNVASYCGYTKSHYESLVELWQHVTSSDYSQDKVEILAFPCNQFGQQEPGTADEIKQFAAEQGVHFRMMEKIDVNGPTADTVYLYLKQQAGPPSIAWNFATYFVVSTDGAVESFSGLEPMELQPRIQELLTAQEEL